MDEKEEKTLTKKDLKLRAQEIKLEEKQRKMEEKAEMKAEKERRKNSFGRKVRNFFLTIIVTIIIVIVAFFLIKDYLGKREILLNNEKLSQIYQEALTAINEKDYEKAIELLKSITSDYEDFEMVEEKLKEIEQLYLNEYLTNANNYLEEEKFDKALSVLNSISSEFQDATVVIEKKVEIHIAKINAEISKLDSEEVLEILEYLTTYDTENLEDLNDEINELISTYKDQFILEARELMKTDYDKAKERIDEAKELLPDDKDINELVEELTEFEPVSLVSLTPESKTGKLTIYNNAKNSIKDIEGNEYSNYILSLDSNTEETNTVEYKLDKAYSKLTGTICILQSSKDNSPTGTAKIKIYNGDEVIYTSEEISSDKGNLQISVDVSEVETLKIEVTGNVGIGYFIANPQLTKN